MLALPLTVSPSGSMATLEQDSPPEVTQAVALLLATRPGERRSVPDYGFTDPLFDGVDPTQLAAAVAEWEERADLLEIEVALTGVEQDVTVHPTAPETT